MEIDLSPSVDFVNYQTEAVLKMASGSPKSNAYSFLKRIIISNDSDIDIRNARLDISFLPEAIKCLSLHLVVLEKHKKTEANSFSIEVDPEYLYVISEAMAGKASFTLVSEDETILIKEIRDIQLLPLEQATSYCKDPALLSCFVTPNDDAVRALAYKAAKELGEKYGRSSFEGYQLRDINTVNEEIDAIYLAIQKEGIAYSNPPASFDAYFQRVRLPSNVITEKVATCVDFSLLFASVLESVGLHSLLVFEGTHAFFGVWLEETSFPSSIEENPTALLNEAASGIDRMVLVDAVGVASGYSINYQQAIENGLAALKEGKPFHFALDIYACRNAMYRPVPTYHIVEGRASIDFSLIADTDYSIKKFTPDRSVLEADGAPKNKFDLWEEKLLDLDMRNGLINLRMGGSTLQVLCTNPSSFLNNLKDGDRLSLVPKASEATRERRYLANEALRNLYPQELNEGLKNKRLYLVSGDGAPEKALVSLSRKANTEIEESGCNPLFLTIGAIKWFDNDHAASLGTGYFISPIILIPCSIPRRRSGPHFSLEVNLDGICFNTTVFEYFREHFDLDFAEFNNFLSDKANTLSFQKTCNTIRGKIAHKLGWDIIEDFSALSLFSFAHFVMWSDMKNHRSLFLQNPVVASLVDMKAEWGHSEKELKLSELDDVLAPADLAIPLPADSSQIEAIAAAAKGESFVLDGPPGTGKSQTIANMIVNLLYSGKRVLFVAEKEVALQVVKDRLDKLGLGTFCLQIHSAKANKREVLSQVSSSLELGAVKPPEGYEGLADSILKQRQSLNNELHALHDEKPFFMSVYDAILTYLQDEAFAFRYFLEDDYVKNMDRDLYNQSLATLEDLSTRGSSLGGLYNSPFIFFQSETYDMEKRDLLFRELPAFIRSVNSLNKTFLSVLSRHFKKVPASRNGLFFLNETLSSLRENNDLLWNHLNNSLFLSSYNDTDSYLCLSLALSEKIRERNTYLSPSVDELNIASLVEEAKTAASLPFLKKRKVLKRVKKTLTMYRKERSSLRGSNFSYCLNLLSEIDKGRRLIMDRFSAYPLSLFPHESTLSPEEIMEDKKRLARTKSLASLVESLSLKNEEERQGVYAELQLYLTDKDYLFSNEVSSFLTAFTSIKEANETLKEAYGFDFFYGPDTPKYLDRSLALLKTSIDNKGRLNEWSNFLKALKEAASILPSSLIESYQNGKVLEKELTPSFKATLAHQVAALSLREEGISSISASTTDKEIDLFREALGRFSELAVKETAARVSSRFPATGIEYAASTEVYQLSHLCANGGRGKSLRGILNDHGNLLSCLCPCFFMSPLSVAQYLDPDKKQFDVVIFDEASQIPTREAIGAIARSKSVIIAGDQRQMPPTNFFTSSLFNADSEDVIYDDLESLLDDAIALRLPRHPLSWHYRSNHESLIAFSNSRFYMNRLLTFPSPENQISKVSFRYVNGIYEPGRRVNKKEAEEIVKEVIKRLKDPELRKKSIGIVTFNEKQQTLIDDLLDKKLAASPSLDIHPGGEDIFIKNLENVQGDERDVILFSICFAPDKKTGKMPLNFGALSREKGERRLNVAVSRARDQMIVFSGVYPEEIRSNEAKNEGAGYLRDFLSYAKYGVSALSNIIGNNLFTPREGVVFYLAKELRRLGLEVDENLGTSSFRIDLGIKDPKDKNKYALGIITDSDLYCAAPTCRDRNLIQPKMLSRLGWRIFHFWSSEYFDHKDVIISSIVSCLENPLVSDDSFLLESPKNISFDRLEVNPYPNEVYYPDTIYERGPFSVLDLALEVVAREWPVSRSVIDRRHKETYNFPRLIKRINDQIDNSLDTNTLECFPFLDSLFYYPRSQDITCFKSYRPHSDRTLFEIHPLEYGNASKDILFHQGPMSKEDLMKQLLSLFGGKALSGKSRTYISASLSYCVKLEGYGLYLSPGGIFELID